MDQTTPRPDTASRADATASRLNPFAFVSDTDVRFVLLNVAVVGSSIFMYHAIYHTVSARLGTYARAVQACRALYLTGAAGNAQAQAAGFTACLAPQDHATGLWIVAGLAILLAIAALGYWFSADLKLWLERDTVQLFSAEDDPELAACVQELSAMMGLARPPTLLTNTERTASGLAFGARGRYFLVLNLGLLMQFRRDRSAFRAVVLHELSHLRNGDVDKTYLALSAGFAFVVAAVVPYLVSLALDLVGWGDRGYGLDYVFNVAWRVVALVALVYCFIAGLLRAREFYADVRALVWDAPDGALRRVIERQESGAPRSKWWGLTGLHPLWSERRAVLDDPRRLFHLSIWDALATGIVSTVAFANVTMLFGLFLSGSQQTYLAELGAGLIFGPIAAGIIVLGVWRAAFVSVVERDSRSKSGRLALGLGAGMMVGVVLSLTDYLNNSIVDAIQFPVVAYDVIWGLAVMSSLWLFLRLSAAGARAWLRLASSRSSLGSMYLIGLSVAAALLAVWFGVLFLVHDFSVALLEVSAPGSSTLVTVGGVSVLALAALLTLAALVLTAFRFATVFSHSSATAETLPRWGQLDYSEGAMAAQLLDPDTDSPRGSLMTQPSNTRVDTSEIAEHHGWFRYTGKIVEENGQTLDEGLHLAQLDDAGRLCRVINFPGPTPTPKRC